jgi:hypothetical protein
LRIQPLVHAVLSDDLIDLLPLHIMDADRVASFVRDCFANALSLPGADMLSQEERADLFVAILFAIFPRWWRWEEFRRAKSGDAESLIAAANKLTWKPYERRANAELKHRADVVGWEQARREVLEAGLYRALQESEVPQRIKLGSHLPFEHDADGRPAQSIPWDHDLRRVAWWLHKQTVNHMEAALNGEEPRSPRLPPNNDDLGALLDDTRSALQRTADTGRLGKDAVDPVTMELLVYVGAGISRAEAARRIGITPNNAYVRLHRLKRRLERL